jgi:hypothetical protein
LATLEVERTWKGRATPGVKVVLGSGERGADCPDVALVTGASYLVYARGQAGHLVASVCTRTRSAGRAADDIRALDRLRAK